MTTLSESLFPPSNRRRCVKGRTSYTESAENIMCSENINIDADDSYSLDHNGYDCIDSNEIEDVEEEPVTIDLQAFLSENPLLTEPASDCGVDSNINLSDCHSQFRVTSYQPDLSSSVIENVLTSEPAITNEKNVLPELAINSMLITEKSAGENESSAKSENIPVAVTEESMSSKENVFVNGKKQSPKKFVKSKTHMGLSNPLKKYKNFVKMKDINKTSVKVFGKYPVVKCEKLDIENFMKKNNIKVRNWPLLHNNINKTKLALNNSGTITKKLNPKKPNIKIPKLFKKPISFNKYISLPKSGSSVNKSHSILVDSLDAVAKSDMESENFKLQVSPASSPVKNLMQESSGSPLYQEHRFPNVIKQNPVCGQKLVKIIRNDSYSQGNDSGAQTRKLPIITSVNKVGVNPKTFQFVSTKHLTDMCKNTDVLSNLPKPVVETISTPVLKDYTVIEPYVDDPASPVKPKPIITVPVEIIPSPELPKKESVAETPHVTIEHASTSAKQGKTPRSVFLNGAVKQISTPIRHDAELIGKIDEISKDKDLNMDSDKNILDQCPSVLKAKNIVVGVMESVFSMTQKSKKVSKLKPNVNRVQKNPRNASVGSTLECQTYNTTLNDILFGFDEIDDLTDECTSLNSSSEISAVTPISDSSNNVIDSSHSWQPDKKEINAVQLTNDKRGLPFSDEKQTVKEHSEKARKKRKLFESPHNSDTWSASECENENDIPRKKKLNPKKKRPSRLVGNLQKVTRNDVKANISSEPERTVDNISVQKSLNDSLKINPSVSPKKLKHAEKRTVKTSDKSPISTNRLQELPYVSPISNQSELSITHSESSDKIVKDVPKSPSLRNRRNSHDRADRSSIKNKSTGRVDNESKPFSENVPNFKRNISKRLSRYKISSESKKGGKYMRSNFKSEMKNKRKRKTLMRGKKKLSKPDDIIREIKTITGGNIPRGKSKKISYSSASEKDDPEFDAVSDDSESETCSSKLRNNSPGRANSRKKVRTLKVLFKRAKRKKSSNNQSMDFNPISISVLDNANNSNSVLDSNKSLNSTFREGDREKMDTSCKAESKIENDTFVCETKPEYFIVENNVQCDDASAISSMYQVASPVKNSVNTDISKVDGTKFVVSTRNSGDDEVNSNSNEVQDIRNLLLKIVETISCEPIYTDSDSDEESINSNLNNSVPELEVDSNKNVVNLPTVNENIDLNVDAESEISINSSAIDPTSSIAQNLNSELYESTINVAHSSKNLSENKKPHMAKRKCPKIKISISKTVIDTDGREESWYISERKPSTDSVQSEVSSEEAKVESEAEIICDKLNIMLEASSMPAISEKEISQSATKTCDESLEHLVQGANDNNSNTDVSSNNVENPDMTEDIPHFSNELSECEVAEQQCILPDGQQQVMGSQCSVKAFDSFAGKKEESIESVNPKEALVTETVSESGDLAKSECSVEAHASSIIESEVSVEAECSVEAVSSAGESEKQVKLECSLERVSSDVENGEPLKPEYSVEEINSAVESEEPTKSEHSMDVISSAVENEEPVKSQIFDTSAAKKEEPVIECSVKNPSDTPTDSTVRIHKELSVALEVMNNFATDVKSPKSLKRKRNSTPLRASGRSNVKVEASSDCSGKEQTSKVEKKSPKSSPHVTPVRKKNYDPEAVTIPFTMVEKKSPKSSPHVTPVRKKNYDPEAVTVPFTMGWMRELVHRANQEEGRKQSDIYYFAPEGVKLRSMREVAAYLSKKENYALTVENFTYAKELIYREPFEIERSAKQKASVCNTPSPSSNLSSVNTSKRKQHSVSKKQTPPTHSKKQTAPTYSSSSKEHSSKSPKNDTLETARNSGTRKSTRRTSLNTEECVKKENEDSDSIKPRPSRKIIKKVPFDNSFEEKTPVRKCRLDNKQNSSTENKTSAPVILSDSSTKSNTHLSANKSGKLFTSPSNNTENTSSVNLSVDKQSSNQPPKTQKRYKVKCTYSKTESMVQRPCTPLCRVAHYQYPSVQCAICLCLFHPSCVPPVSRGVKFACKPCTIVKLESNRLRVNSATASIPVCEIPDASLENIDSSLLEPEVICQTYSAALPVNCMSDRIPGVLFTQLSVPNLPFENSQRKMFFCCSYSNSPTIANNPLSNYSSTLGEVRSTLNQLKVLSSSTMPEARGVTSSQTFPSNNSSFNFTSLSSHQQKCLGIPRAAINNPVSCRYMVYNIKKPSSNICGGLQYSSMNRNIPRPVLQKNASEFSSVQPPPTVLTEQLKQPSYTYSRSEALYNTSVPSCSYQTSKSFVQDMEMERVLNPTKKTKFSVTPESNSTNIRSNHTSIRNNVSASKTVSSDIAASSSSSTDLKSLSVEDNCRDYVENALNVIVSANNNSKTCQESFKKSDALCSKQQLIGEKLGSDHTSSSSEEAAVNDCKYLPFVFKMLSICDLLRASQVCRSWRDIASQDTLWERVSFCGQRVTDWDKCCQALKKHCTKSLDLCGIVLEDSSDPWEDLERNLIHLGEVEELSFDKVSPSVVISVANNMPRLHILECPFVTVSFTEPEMWFVTCGLELSSLRFLGRLEHLKIGSAGGIVLNGSCSSLMPYLPNLRHVALTGFKFHSHGNLECLAQMQQLISLELGDCSDIEPGIYVLLGKMRKLKKLRLENGGNVKDTKFAEALSKMEGLEQLELMNFQMPSLCTVLSELQHLKQINIWPDNATEGPLVNYNSYEAISRCKNLKYICWGIIAEGDTIPEVLELKASASENEIKKLTYKQLFQELVELFPKIKVEVKCVPRELWREFCSTRK